MKRVLLTMFLVLFAGSAMADGIGIAAVVDDQVISSVDFEDRMALAMGMTAIPDTPENRARILPHVLHQLVDEKLQIAEATRNGITINDAKLKEGVAQLEKQNGKPPGSLLEFLQSRGLSKISFYSQIRAQMAWGELVRKKIRPRVKISDQEVARYMARKVAPPVAGNSHAAPSSGRIEEVLITMIHIPVDAPANESNVRKLAEKLAGEIRSGANFEAVASQFSSSAGGTKASAPFWVEMAQVDPAIAQALVKIQKGGVTDPVRTAAGYQIIKLVDVRQAKAEPAAAAPAPAAPQERAELAFKQVLMTLKPDAKVKEAELLLDLAKEVQKSPGKCEDKSMAGAGDLADMDFRVTFTRALSSDLPDKLRDFLMQLKVGAASDPVVTPQGIRLFVLCERIDLPSTPGKNDTIPQSDEAVRQAIYTEKLELEAQKYLRDLRRDAFIEVRGAQ